MKRLTKTASDKLEDVIIKRLKIPREYASELVEAIYDAIASEIDAHEKAEVEE
jgi:nucleoid DNA-binding protein